MKKHLMATGIIGALALSANAQTLTEQQETSLVKGIMPSTKIDKVERAEIDGFYKAFLGNGNMLYINPFKRVIFIGEIYTAGGVSLTANDRQEWQNELQNQLLKNIKIDELMRNAKKVDYGKGSKRYEVLIFTDPECPYCAKLEEFLEQKDVSVYVNFLPLNFHKNAKRWSEQILSSKDIKAAIKQIRLTQKDLNVKVSKEAQKTLKATMALGEKLKINGTPKVFIIDKKDKNKIVATIDGANLDKVQEFLNKDRQ